MPLRLKKKFIQRGLQSLEQPIIIKNCGKPFIRKAAVNLTTIIPEDEYILRKMVQHIFFLSPHITAGFVPEIKVFFGISGDMKIHYDHTPHYYCHLDEGWRSYT